MWYHYLFTHSPGLPLWLFLNTSNTNEKDTNGWSTGFSPSCFGKCYPLTNCLLSCDHIYSAACRCGGLNRPPAGSRDAPTQENQATPLARLQTAVSNTSPGLKASRGWCIFLNLKPVLGSFPWPENILLVWTSLLLMWRTRLLKNTKQWHFHPVLYFSFTLFFLSLITFLTACYPNSSASALTLLLFEDQSGCEVLLQFEFFHSTKVLNSFCFSQLAILHLKLYSYHFANFFCFVLLTFADQLFWDLWERPPSVVFILDWHVGINRIEL